ncbi:hypothetical protein DFH08DRAFT_916756 [Mycena albidolilacea]|uniref:Uncharacterized protein n=1 Tax=Mycena albidolilacea TaxID=1033008 RepID=A0AAD6ZLT5_9AGAR|nr:hypothetical protein DFH08DRAFT_916756 [Mycena albidolilacea]
MPAMAKLMWMKGQTLFRDEANGGRTNYIPLYHPDRESYDPLNLPLRNYDELIEQAVKVDTAPTDAEAERHAKNTGINGLPLLAALSSLSFPDSFAHNLMPLIPQNIIKNLLDLWTDNFKGLDEGEGEYQLESAVIDEIGGACVLAGDTTLASFGARTPNPATQRHYFMAESYTLWATLWGPVLLHGRFEKPKYCKHFLQLVKIFNNCLKLSIDREYVDTELWTRIADWVQRFEKCVEFDLHLNGA